MSDLRRASALSGLGAALTILVAGIFGNVGRAPSPFRASGAELIEHYSRYAAPSDASALFNMLAAVLVIVFATGLWMRFCEAESPSPRGWALVGLMGAGSLAVLSMVVALAGISLVGLANIGAPSGDAVRVAAIALTASMQVAGLAAVPMLAGFGVAGLAYAAHARWLAWMAVVAAAAGLLSVLPDVVASFSVGLADLLGLIGQLELPLMLLWLIGVSFSFRRRRTEEE